VCVLDTLIALTRLIAGPTGEWEPGPTTAWPAGRITAWDPPARPTTMPWDRGPATVRTTATTGAPKPAGLDSVVSLFAVAHTGPRRYVVDSRHLSAPQWSTFAAAVAGCTAGRLAIDLARRDDPRGVPGS